MIARDLVCSASASALLTAILATAPPALSQDMPNRPHWVGSWGADPAFPSGPEINNQTIRQVMRLSLGGHAIRIRLTNEMGSAALVIGAAHLARPGAKPGTIDTASDHVLTFGGRTSVTIPVGAPAISDPATRAALISPSRPSAPTTASPASSSWRIARMNTGSRCLPPP